MILGRQKSTYNEWESQDPFFTFLNTIVSPEKLTSKNCIVPGPSGLESVSIIGRHQPLIREWEIGVFIPLALTLPCHGFNGSHNSCLMILLLYLKFFFSPPNGPFSFIFLLTYNVLLYLQFLPWSTMTISSLLSFQAQGDNSFPLLLIPGCFTIPMCVLSQYMHLQKVTSLDSLQLSLKGPSVSYWMLIQ